MGSQARRCPRYPFYASAEITEIETHTKLNARTSEVSRYGCYVDMMNPLRIGMGLLMRVTYDEQSVNISGRVIYSQPNVGMGVAFETFGPGHERTLEKWLEHLKTTV
jgi:PilZ domain